jgi:hypothetical protein
MIIPDASPGTYIRNLPTACVLSLNPMRNEDSEYDNIIASGLIITVKIIAFIKDAV